MAPPRGQNLTAQRLVCRYVVVVADFFLLFAVWRFLTYLLPLHRHRHSTFNLSSRRKKRVVFKSSRVACIFWYHFHRGYIYFFFLVDPCPCSCFSFFFPSMCSLSDASMFSFSFFFLFQALFYHPQANLHQPVPLRPCQAFPQNQHPEQNARQHKRWISPSPRPHLFHPSTPPQTNPWANFFWKNSRRLRNRRPWIPHRRSPRASRQRRQRSQSQENNTTPFTACYSRRRRAGYLDQSYNCVWWCFAED